MARPSTNVTGVERTFGADEIIVSKTDPKGRITYANEVFLRVAQFTEVEVLGQAHCIVRHPAMPRCVFRFMWDTIQSGHEIFAYVINRAKSGDHYWVFAHVTPTMDDRGAITGFHSNRRCPERRSVDRIRDVYESLWRVEQRQSGPREQVAAGMAALGDFLRSKGTSYEELIFSI
ncbi:MAG: PAS domain-containing protein [Phycisphaerales bacterium]